MNNDEHKTNHLLLKYSADTSNELLNHLKRHFVVNEIKHRWITDSTKMIQVNDKIRLIENNKKFLVGTIYNIVEDQWISLGEKKIRRTIKKYLDGIK